MLELPSTLYYASSFQIHDNGGKTDLFDAVMQFMYEFVSVFMEIRYDSFLSHGVFTTSDHVKVSIASHYGTPPSSKVWAAMLRVKDASMKRRRWTIHLGVRQDKDTAPLTVNYAEFYADQNAGALIPLQAPPSVTPIFVQKILQEKSFNCVVGHLQVPTDPIKLDFSNLPSFIDLFFDNTRTIPIIVITCPDLADPIAFATAAMGNTVVFLTSDPGVIFAINEHMPKEHLVPFDTVQIYFPFWDNKPNHFTYSADALGRLGSKVLTSIRRAFCESVPSQFRKEFVTYDDIMQLRNVNSISHHRLPEPCLGGRRRYGRDNDGLRLHRAGHRPGG